MQNDNNDLTKSDLTLEQASEDLKRAQENYDNLMYSNVKPYKEDLDNSKNKNEFTPQLNQQIAFCHCKDYAVPGIITQIYNNSNLVDLKVQIPYEKREVTLKGIDVKSQMKYYLIEQIRPLVKFLDPRTIFVKQEVALANVMRNNEGEIAQSVSDKWVNSGKLDRIPRLDNISTNIIGTYFDPSFFEYKVYCFRGEYVLPITEEKIEAIEVYFPKVKKDNDSRVYENYVDCFNRYFKERYKRWNEGSGKFGKWDRVEIRAIEKI